MSSMRLAGCLAAVAMVCCGTVGRAQSTLFFSEDFSYAEGALSTVSEGAWTAFSSAGSQPLLVDDPDETPTIDGDEVAVVKQISGGAEDLTRPTGSTMTAGSTWYYGAKFSVQDLRPQPDTPLNSGTSTYFLHFRENGTTGAVNFRGRLYIRPGSTLNTFTLGISSSSVSAGPPVNGAIVDWTGDLTFGTSYNVMVGYTADDDDTDPLLVRDGFADLWVNPATIASPKVTDMAPNTNVSADLTIPQVAVALRQGSVSTTAPNILIDTLAAGTDFEDVLAELGSVVTPSIDADFDGDLDVDGNDFVIWQRNLGAGATNAQGNTDGDTDVDATDLANWRAKFGQPVAVGAASAVPEPAAVAMMICGLLGIAAQRSRRR
ncbi:MAG TPA: hypothetical protein VEQ85_06370 [Lacipirellulaceae bacterium]|nr:hypothetical protein [Lacipirellulaceae bacterium]